MSVFRRRRVKRNHSLAEGIMQIFPRTCTEADYTSDVLSQSYAVVAVVVVQPSAIPRGIYPWYSGRSHFGNRGTVDVRVERRLAPSGGDDKSSCGWHGSGSGSFYGSPARMKENGRVWWFTGGRRGGTADGYLILSCKRRGQWWGITQ